MGNLGSAVLSATGGQQHKLGITNESMMQAYVGLPTPTGIYVHIDCSHVTLCVCHVMSCDVCLLSMSVLCAVLSCNDCPMCVPFTDASSCVSCGPSHLPITRPYFCFHSVGMATVAIAGSHLVPYLTTTPPSLTGYTPSPTLASPTPGYPAGSAHAYLYQKQQREGMFNLMMSSVHYCLFSFSQRQCIKNNVKVSKPLSFSI